MKDIRYEIVIYDLRRYIRPGDVVTYKSQKEAFTAADFNGHYGCRCTVPVVAVYRDFAVTKLKIVKDCVNRWNIEELNGRPFKLYIQHYDSTSGKSKHMQQSEDLLWRDLDVDYI